MNKEENEIFLTTANSDTVEFAYAIKSAFENGYRQLQSTTSGEIWYIDEDGVAFLPDNITPLFTEEEKTIVDETLQKIFDEPDEHDEADDNYDICYGCLDEELLLKVHKTLMESLNAANIERTHILYQIRKDIMQ